MHKDKVSQGLFSRVKGTNFINTILNIRYCKIGFKLTNTLYTEPGLKPESFQLGDDVFISYWRLTKYLAFYVIMLELGFVLQNVKRLLGASS